MLDKTVHLVFDLDDTLYPEFDYARSALQFVGTMVEAAFATNEAKAFLLQAFENGERDAIGGLWAHFNLPKVAQKDIIAAMRGHRPDIKLPRSSASLLDTLSEKGIEWSILTDGRSLTQRRKVEALELSGASGLYISEERGVSKPALKAYTQIANDHPDMSEFWYIADNPIKDFVTPNALGWKTIMLRDKGQNIHPQDIDIPKAFHAAVEIEDLIEVLHVE